MNNESFNLGWTWKYWLVESDLVISRFFLTETNAQRGHCEYEDNHIESSHELVSHLQLHTRLIDQSDHWQRNEVNATEEYEALHKFPNIIHEQRLISVS